MFRRWRSVCPGCDVYCPDEDDRRLFRGWAGAYALWSLIGGVVVVLNGPGGALTFIMLQVMCLGGFLASATHEAGHALAAAALGGQAPEVTLGRGPAVGRLRWGDTCIRIGRYAFLGGQTRIVWPGRGSRWQVAAAMLAGPAANLAAAAAFFWLVQQAETRSVAQAALAGFGLAQLGAGAFNLLPAPAELGQPASDGSQAWAALTRPRRPD